MSLVHNGVAQRQFCTFVVQGSLFGLDVAHVQEVLMQQRLTPVPLAPAAVCGLLNLRGQIVTAIDLRARLGLPPRPAGVEAMNVVVRIDDAVASLQVDDIGDVIDVDAAAIERPPETLRGTARALVREVCKLDGRLLLVLDGRATIDVKGDVKADVRSS